MTALLNATVTDFNSKLGTLTGDIYLPTVDNDFLPLASSELTLRGHFPRIPIIIRWTEDDMAPFTPRNITTASTTTWLSTYYPGLSNTTIDTILSLYPTTEFTARVAAAKAISHTNHKTAEFYRAAQIFRDSFLVCPSLLFGHAMTQQYHREEDSNRNSPLSTTTSTAPVFFYAQNQTIRKDALHAGGGVIHGSELAYVYANFTPWERAWEKGGPGPTNADYKLLRQESRSWSTFANTGAPSSADGKNTLVGWEPAYKRGSEILDARIYVVGGTTPGMSGLGGAEVLARERLRERCAFFNSEEVIRELQY